MPGSALGWAVIAVVSRPPKSYGPTVSSEGETPWGRPASHRARTVPACRITCVLAGVAARSTLKSGRMNGCPSSSRVRIERLRYHCARPSPSRMPWSMPGPLVEPPADPAGARDPRGDGEEPVAPERLRPHGRRGPGRGRGYVAEAAFLMSSATSPGLDTYTAWLPPVSVTVAPARSAMARCAGGGIMWSSAATR